MVENQPKYVLTQDTVGFFSTIGNCDLSTDREFYRASGDYLQSLADILSESIRPVADLVMFSEEEINRQLTIKITTELQDREAICICLDRFLLKNLERDEQYREKFFRFSMCRSVTGERVPRQMQKSFSEQIQTIKKLVPDVERKKVILVDNGVFTGGTINEFIKLATENGVIISVKKILGFIGNNTVKFDDSFPPIEIMESVTNLYDWIDIRDFGPLAGKMLARSKSNKVTSSVPYLFPWSNGEDASLNLSPSLLNDSVEMIKAFRELVSEYERSTGNYPLTFRELVKVGFPLPTNLSKSIPVSINDTIINYLDRCLELIKKEQARFVYVFDMDGTLYQLSGLNNSYKDSDLEKAVLKNALCFIQLKEQCSKEEAKRILQEALTDSVGISVFLSSRYGITRKEYFDEVWNIDPQNIVQKYEKAVEAIKTLAKQFPERKFILLTLAPRIWVERVLKYLRIAEYFEIIFTGEQYGRKGEIFTVLARRYKKEKIVSIGDQYETDIAPAEDIGIMGVKIDKPDDLSSLTNSDNFNK